jgi:DNA-binding MarR family transcriptional regulator
MKSENTSTLGFLLHDATRLVRRRFELRGQAFGLSSAQWRLLVHLVREGSASQARIAELLEIEAISVSRLVDRMQQAGWVERGSDPADRRVRLLKPSEKAIGAFAEVKAVAGEIYDQALEGLSAEEREILIRGLALVAANLTKTERAEAEQAEMKGPAA